MTEDQRERLLKLAALGVEFERKFKHLRGDDLDRAVAVFQERIRELIEPDLAELLDRELDRMAQERQRKN